MLPRQHILLGLVFSLLVWIILPWISWFYILIIFLSSFLIDFDHYLVAVYHTKNIGLINALKFYEMVKEKQREEHKRGMRKRGLFFLFHTIEFHLVVLLIGISYEPFIYIFIGMVFHSMVDFIDLSYKNLLYKREYFLTRWIIQKLK